MAAEGSTRAVIAAVAGNATLAALKFLAFAVSGSGAMLSEAIHSTADTTNQALLYLGIRLSKRPADSKHPYGYGAERYFWSLVSAMGIFILGAGVTVYHGVDSLVHPEEIHIGWITWSALVAAFLLDGGVFTMALRIANKRRAGRSWTTFIREARDPALLAVLFEDGVACFGVLLAVAGIAATRATGNVAFDSLASILIGALLGVMAVALAVRNRALLLGESANPELERRIRRIVMKDPIVGRVLHVKTRVLDADAHLVDLQVDFNPDHIVDRLKPEIQAAAAAGVHSEAELEAFARSFAHRVVDELARDVDRLEERIREAVPTARIIDVEGD